MVVPGSVAGFGGRLFGGRVQPLYIINRNTLLDIDDAGVSRINWVTGTTLNSTLSKIVTAGGVIPVGSLAGSVGVIKGGLLAGPPTAADAPVLSQAPVGVFINDASGRPFESSSAVGSGKAAMFDGSGSVMSISVYETNVRTFPGGAHAAGLLTYVAGDLLFVDTYSGLLVNRVATDSGGATYNKSGFDRDDVTNGVYPDPVAICLAPPVDFGFMTIKWLK